MFVIPCIDIMDGECVQLVGGKAATKKGYGDPMKWLENWSGAGADIVHVIDLDATLKRGSNKDVIISLIEADLAKIQVGGGIRDVELANQYVEKGAERVIIGSRALDAGFMRTLNDLVPKKKIMAALDTVGGKVAVNGWRVMTEITAKEALVGAIPYAGSILATNVDREGLLGGSDTSSAAELIGPNAPVYVSGGFTTTDDLKLAKAQGFAGVVIGKALFENRLKLEELW